MICAKTAFLKERESDDISPLFLKISPGVEKKIDLKMDEVPKNDGHGPSYINYYQPLTQNRCTFGV